MNFKIVYNVDKLKFNRKATVRGYEYSHIKADRLFALAILMLAAVVGCGGDGSKRAARPRLTARLNLKRSMFRQTVLMTSANSADTFRPRGDVNDGHRIHRSR